MLCHLRTTRRAVETSAMLERSRMISSKTVVDGKNRLHAEITKSKGRDVLNDPVFNKGLAFPSTERDRMGLRGLLPSVVRSMKEQEKIVMDELCSSWSERKDDMIDKDEAILKSGIHKEDVRRKEVLMGLHERNETLYYKIIMDNFLEMSRIIYTPTVGWACARYSGLYKKPRGMFFSWKDKGEFASMVFNWDSEKVDVVVVTDGSRVLGLGDLGIGGLGISIGKLDLYIAAGGFHPRRVLPVVIDVGTDNPKLRNDPNYMGLVNPRLQGWEYYEVIDEFMEAVALRWPKALVQFEDFQTKHAIKLLQRYKNNFLMFNDDIQGTAATVLAGLYGAMKLQGKPLSALASQKIVLVGAGSAATGVALTVRKAMVLRMGLTMEEAAERFYILDKDGLISKDRSNLSELDRIFYKLKDYARKETDMEGLQVLEVVKRVKPGILIGLTGVGGIFNEDVLTAMNHDPVNPPVIFALSNPTSHTECTPEEALRCTNGRAIYASGSPFTGVLYNGKAVYTSQCNNRFIFPGLGLGAALGQTGKLSSLMINKASEALVELITEEDLSRGAVFPDLADVRSVSCHLAARVIEQAMEEGLELGNEEAVRAAGKGFEALKVYIWGKMWYPSYRPLVYKMDNVSSECS
eukprot:GFUD01004499.1.p1 GENE.GFUD01004499.1~~GFUD01004499.1.p1  ORF type:complete len:635 (-),score=141.95 GFUD01004499.1:214-2118(-)